MNSTNQKTSNSSWLKTFSIGLSIISVGITIAIIGYIILATKQTQPINQQPIISPQPSLTPSDETANWKMYTNAEYAYSIKYPNNWYDRGSYEEDWYIDQVFSNTPPDRPNPKAQSIRVRVIKGVGPKWKDTKSYFDEVYNDPNGSHILIDNVPATRIVEIPSKEKATKPYYSINVYFYNKGVVYKIYIIAENKEIAEKIESIFDQILSTFKFTQ